MSTITGFNPIKSINSLIQPLGLAVSNKQQIINKIALASFAMLAFSYVPQAADALCSRSLVSCVNSCVDLYYKGSGRDQCFRQCC